MAHQHQKSSLIIDSPIAHIAPTVRQPVTITAHRHQKLSPITTVPLSQIPPPVPLPILPSVHRQHKTFTHHRPFIRSYSTTRFKTSLYCCSSSPYNRHSSPSFHTLTCNYTIHNQSSPLHNVTKKCSLVTHLFPAYIPPPNRKPFLTTAHSLPSFTTVTFNHPFHNQSLPLHIFTMKSSLINTAAHFHIQPPVPKPIPTTANRHHEINTHQRPASRSHFTARSITILSH